MKKSKGELKQTNIKRYVTIADEILVLFLRKDVLLLTDIKEKLMSNWKTHS